MPSCSSVQPALPTQRRIPIISAHLTRSPSGLLTNLVRTFGQVLGPTLEYLREALPHLTIKTKEVDLQKTDALKSSNVDLFIAPPLIFWSQLLENGASAIGMLSPLHSKDPRTSTAGVLITKADRKDLRNEKDLSNKKIAVRAKGLNHEYLLLKHWLSKKGMQLEKSADVLSLTPKSLGPQSALGFN